MLTNKTLLLTIGLCIAALTASAMAVAPSATINYKIKINDQDVATVPAGGGGIVTVGTPFEVSIWVNVPDADMGGGFYGGVLQYALHFTESGSALTPDEATAGPQQTPTGDWDSTSVFPIANYKGDVTNPGNLVYGQAGQIPAGDWGTYWEEFGAGPGVWSKVGAGDMTWNGDATFLTLTPDELLAQVFYGYDGEIYGGYTPTGSSLPDSVEFVPEPATMTLLAFGGLALIRRRRRA